MRTLTSRTPLLLALIVLAAGCGGEDATGPNSGLNEQDAAALADLLLGSTVAALNSPSQSPSLAATIMINYQFASQQACPAGGNLGVNGNLTGSFNSDTGSGSAWLQVLGTYTDCTFNASDVDHVVNGNPYLTITGSFTWLGGVPATQQSIDIGGALDIDGRFCAIDLSILYATAGGSSSVSGTVCGISVNESV